METAVPRFDPLNQCLWWGERRAELSANAFRMLAYLLEHPHQLVTKDTLLDAVWPNSHVVDAVLSVTVSQLRDALCDDPRRPRFIETVYGRGYRWIGELADSSAAGQPLADTSSIVVGRDASLADLTAALARATTGRRQVVFVTGEPGIGKTTLVDQFLRGLGVAGLDVAATQPPLNTVTTGTRTSIRVARGQCIDAYGMGEPYMPLLEALQQMARTSSQVVDVLRTEAPTWLLQMPGLLASAEHEQLRRVLASSTSARMVRELPQALERLAVDAPIILLLEDLHWSDVATVAALAGIAMRREPARLLIIGTYRPVDAIAELHPIIKLVHELAAKRQCSEIALDGLDGEAISSYLGARFPDHVFPPEVAQHLRLQTTGNPLFLLNAVDDLEQRQWIERVDGRWRCMVDPSRLETAVPDGTRAMIESRLAGLAPESSSLLEAASVIGPSFASQALAAVVDRDASEIELDCAAIARAGLFLKEIEPAHWPDGSCGAQFAFRHSLYQQVLYDRVTAARRKHLHKGVAERLERGFGDDAGEFAGALALHYEFGGDIERSLPYHERAAELALSRFSFEPAAAQFRRALGLLRRLPAGPARDARERDLQSALITCIYSTDGPGAAELEAIAGRVEVLSEASETTQALLTSLFGLIGFFITRSDLGRAEAVCMRAMQRAALVDWGEFYWNVARGLLGFVQHRRGRLADAIPNLTAGAELPMIGASGMMEPSTGCASDLGFSLILMGHLRRGLEVMRDAEARADATAHPPTMIYSSANMLRIGQMFADPDLVASTARKVGEMGDRLASQRFLAYRLLGEGWVQMHQGRADGIALYTTGVDVLVDYSHLTYQPYSVQQLSAGLLRMGQVDESRALLSQAFGFLASTDARWCEAELHRQQGEIAAAAAARTSRRGAARAQAMDEAETCFRRACDVARAQGARWWELQSCFSLTRLLHTQRRGDEELRELRRLHAEVDDGLEIPALAPLRNFLAGSPAP